MKNIDPALIEDTVKKICGANARYVKKTTIYLLYMLMSLNVYQIAEKFKTRPMSVIKTIELHEEKIRSNEELKKQIREISEMIENEHNGRANNE